MELENKTIEELKIMFYDFVVQGNNIQQAADNNRQHLAAINDAIVKKTNAPQKPEGASDPAGLAEKSQPTA